MKLIEDNLPMEGEEQDGNVLFIHEDYIYNIGTLEDDLWISRQTVEDYENGKDNYEMIDRWVPENKPIFKLLWGNKHP
jgi:hypothetical protein